MDGIDMMEAMRGRHSVRRYTDRRIEDPVKSLLQETIDACNSEGGLRFQLFTDSPGAFDGILSAGFKNVDNYVALVRKASEPDERVGYYGERVVLRAQQLGLRTCWVGLSYSKRRCKAEVADDEKLVCMLAIGYGEDDGTAHKSRPADILGRCEGDAPEWFARGIEAVMLAPSAMNRQRFRFTLLEDGRVRAETSRGPYSDVDLGIAKLHFEIGAGKGNFEWA